MNTEGEKIQWHPAFDAALQIELGEEAKYLTFEPEHLLSKKPMQIDVLVKNEKKVKIRKNIGRIPAEELTIIIRGKCYEIFRMREI